MNALRSGSHDKPLINDAAHDVTGLGEIVDLTARLNAALLPRGVACKLGKMLLKARRGEIHECADLRNRKPTLRANQMQRYGGMLVVREKDLQGGLRKLLSNMIREKSGDAVSFDG